MILIHVINILIVVFGVFGSLQATEKLLLKWCLNGADIAINTGELKKMVSVLKHYNVYKLMRRSQILFGEKQMTSVIRILEEEFINPFSVGYNGLHNLFSGEEVAVDSTLSILEVHENGKKMKEEFITSRMTSNQGKRFDPLKKFNVKLLKL